MLNLVTWSSYIISFLISFFWFPKLAQKELQKINMYKAPRDKLVCILNCCKVINNLLINASIALKDNPPGADDFLPVLIYVTLKASAVFFCKVYSIKLNIKLSFWITIHNSDFLSMFCHFILISGLIFWITYVINNATVNHAGKPSTVIFKLALHWEV